jgi:excisionase family DNA binding protein
MNASAEQALDNRIHLERAAKLKHNPQFDAHDKPPSLAALLLGVIDRLDTLINANLVHKSALTVDEAAAYTGLAVSFLYKLTSTQEIPHYKPRGKMLYFNREELDAWLLGNRVKTIDEINRAALDHVHNFKPATQSQSKRLGAFAGGAQ